MIRVAAILLLSVALGGCWTHRVQTMSPVTSAGADSVAYTSWAFLWRSNLTRPSPECVSEGLKDVTVRSNLGFSLIRALTLGLVAPVRFERECAAPMIDPPEGGNVPSHSATHVTLVWDRLLERDPAVRCDNRPMAAVAVRPNPVFDILSAVTLGLFAASRVGVECAVEEEEP